MKNILQRLWLFFTTGKCNRVMHISQRESNKELLLYLGWQKVTCSISNVWDLTCQALLKIMSRCFGGFFCHYVPLFLWVFSIGEIFVLTEKAAERRVWEEPVKDLSLYGRIIWNRYWTAKCRAILTVLSKQICSQ